MGDSPTFVRRELGGQLKELREARGLSLEKVAAETESSESTVRRWEAGTSGIKGLALKALFALYEVGPEVQATLTALHAQGKKPGWWAPYTDLPVNYRKYIGFESAAIECRNYEPQFVPGLLQTEAYARALISAGYQRITEEQVENRVQIRIRRQERLVEDNPLMLLTVLDESVLMRPVGGAEVMAEQLDHLAAMAKRRNVQIEILPLRAGAYGLAGSFNVLAFPDDSPGVVYAEALTGDLYQEGEAVEQYTVAHESLRAAAASTHDTQTLIREAREAVARPR